MALKLKDKKEEALIALNDGWGNLSDEKLIRLSRENKG